MIYAIPVEPLKDEVAALCWGPGCGHGQIGALVVDGYPCVVCSVEVCPYLVREVATEMRTDDGHLITLRNIKVKS
ncbi:MAG: hypothetical protein COW42_10160 [Deltaproteobacteria bacterium CG17_big_fil_post_rev_8_21_14_2_50_63_7]|nr:MAG: hypothetical protein COW42_10160 [Deltaproteobacteria bacterium CG17_big_fil_post_rev_8_21_14_2_50_63_7]